MDPAEHFGKALPQFRKDGAGLTEDISAARNGFLHIGRGHHRLCLERHIDCPDAGFFDPITLIGRGGELDRVTPILQRGSDSEEWLDIAARADCEREDIHLNSLPMA
ncbi:hypothetical protein L1787_11000 [Acuticoccus sp. M5D2P5]|nr:hypothetical protein [Acuticoccus kalidii]MCF3933944.1 hypothetical protein [Acuticoccus kalidii]